MMELERIVDYLASEYYSCKQKELIDRLAYGVIDAFTDSEALRGVAKQKYENLKFRGVRNGR